MKILVIDDDPAVRASLERALRLEGYEVATAPDGGSGLESLALAPPTRSCSTSACPTSTASRSASGCGRPGTTPGADADGARRCERPGPRPRRRCRRLPGQAVRVGRAAGPPAALLRRRTGEEGDVLRFGDIELDLGTREARRAKRAFSLTRIEFDLLELFLRHPARC